MISKSDPVKRRRANYGFARVRDIAYDAVLVLWHRREQEGWQQKHVAEILDRDPAWVSKTLRGPGNWTLRTFGELVEALEGEVEIKVHALQDPVYPPGNYDAYQGYEPLTEAISFYTSSSLFDAEHSENNECQAKNLTKRMSVEVA